MPVEDPQPVSSSIREPAGSIVVRVRSPSLEAFVEDFADRISDSEIFVPAEGDPPVGTTVLLDFRVGTDWTLIQGKGRILWVRSDPEGMEKPAGICVELVALDAQSEKLLRWVRDDRKASLAGEEPPPAVSAPKSRIEVFDLHGAGPEVMKEYDSPGGERRLGKVLFGAALAVVLLVTLGVGGCLQTWRDAMLREPAGQAETGSSQAPGVEATSPGRDPVPSSIEGVQQTLADWTSAWEDQRAADFLALYARDFEPPNEMNRADWETRRAERIRRPRFVEIRVAELEIEERADGEAIATFEQTYRSDSYEDRVVKELLLVREGGRWLIIEERVVEFPL